MTNETETEAEVVEPPPEYHPKHRAHVAPEFEAGLKRIDQLPGVVMFDVDTPCERNRVFPCLDHKPNKADFMLRFADCSCVPDDDEEPDGNESEVQATCTDCLKYLMNQPSATCGGCRTMYVPAWRIIADIVRIRWS